MKRILLTSLLLSALAAVIQSQTVPQRIVPMGNVPAETLAAMDKLDRAFDENLRTKGWTRERFPPFQPSSGVAERWDSQDRHVRVFISKLSPRTAELFKEEASGEPIEGICDEARVFGYDGNITCRHGEFGVSISSAANVILWSSEGGKNITLNQSEAKATSRLIACFVNLALDGKLTLDWPHSLKPIFQRPCEKELIYKGLISERILKRYTETF